jgi:ubiquinone/menaquinone biosynthesis C-methylase UbiE
MFGTRLIRLGMSALLLVLPVVHVGGGAAAPASSAVEQSRFAFRGADPWGLDLERAMDAVGLAPAMTVGEAGAGDGYFTLPMARRVGPTGRVYANDISTRALRSLERRSAAEHLDNIETVVGRVDDPLFPRHDLQLVVLVHAFHDFEKPVEWLRNLKKYLRPGATVAIIDRDPAQGGGSHFWTRERIVGYAEQAGYERVKGVFDISRHLILVFRPRPTGAS